MRKSIKRFKERNPLQWDILLYLIIISVFVVFAPTMDIPLEEVLHFALISLLGMTIFLVLKHSK